MHNITYASRRIPLPSIRAAIVSAAVLLAPSARGQPALATMVGVQDLAWSHDGRSLYFAAMRVKRDYSDYRPEKWAIYRYDFTTGAVTRFAPTSFSVAASANAALVIVGKLANGNRDLYLVDSEGRELARLTSDAGEDFAASWSPDGRAIAFTSKRGGHSEVYVANADGSNARRLTAPSSDRTLNPTWSPDGHRIAYYREKGDGKDQIHVANVDGGGDVNITNDTFNNVYPGWTPDGRIVYGQGTKGVPTRAFTIGVDGRDKQPLLDIKSFFVRYSPDGSRIAYLTEHPETGVRLVVAARDGTGLTIPDLSAVESR